MRIPRLSIALALFALLLGGLALPPAVGAVGGWTPTAPRPARDDVPPAFTIATTLADGRVLVTESDFGQTGGVAQLYDPAADRWTEAAPFDPHNGHATPTLLPDGRVLFIGGVSMRGVSPSSMVGLATAQAYDPATDTWTPIAPMRDARREHTATPLRDGTVLVVSGDAGPPLYSPRPVVGVERYDPRTDRWTDAAPLARARFGHGATLLPDGRVLVFGGTTAELYDPAADRWNPAADLPSGYGGHPHRAYALLDGRVLALAFERSDIGPALAVYAPAADRWTLAPAPPMATRAYSPLPGGRLLAIGQETRIYDPALNAWAGAPPPVDPGTPQPTDRLMHRATPLRDGRVLLVGERGGQIYAADPASRACFAETGQCVGGRFLAHWEANGGLARNGYPLTGVRIEILEDGNAYQVQYFERVRMEYHPENPAPYDVLLGQFGRRVLLSRRPILGYPAPPIPGQTYFPETGHNLGGPFLAYWQANGGLARFGFPLTEGFSETLEDGKEYEVQYFERARMEYHPEYAGTDFEVLLGQFGRQILAENALVAEPFRYWFVVLQTDRTPLGPATVTPASYQTFERGAMLYRADTRTIYIFPSSQGQTFSCYNVPDTWDPSQPVGGGPGPAPGLYEPKRGFGKAWDEGTRQLLGYATTPDETGYTMTTQAFRVPGARPLTLTMLTRPDGVSAHGITSGGSSAPSCGLIALR